MYSIWLIELLPGDLLPSSPTNLPAQGHAWKKPDEFGDAFGGPFDLKTATANAAAFNEASMERDGIGELGIWAIVVDEKKEFIPGQLLHVTSHIQHN